MRRPTDATIASKTGTLSGSGAHPFLDRLREVSGRRLPLWILLDRGGGDLSLLRRDVDATETDEVFLDADASELLRGLPPLATDEKGAPVVKEEG